MKKISRRHFIPILGTAIVGASCISSTAKPFFNTTDSDFVLPQKLKKGDTIGVSAPAGGIKNKQELSSFEEILSNLGFKTKFSTNCAHKYGYFSGTDQERASDFMDLVEDNDVKAIFFLRGGWGCARILPYIDFKTIKENPKIIMGFSDITTLLNAITTKTGLVTFHGPGGNSSWNDYSVQYINDLILNAKRINYKNTPTDSPILTLSSGVSSGKLFGGNLSIICSLIGTDTLPDWENKILFLEDVGEEPYRIDRMLTQLKQAGVLDKVNGVILGSFRKCTAEEPERSFTLVEVFEQHFSHVNYPVYFGAQIGHTKNKFTVPIGIEVEMNADKGTFVLKKPAVI